MYEIQSISDLQAGAALIVRIPEEDVDTKALYTILADTPSFILPFRHRVIDGQMEFTYQINARSKLLYLSGARSAFEYAELWYGILQPLLDCGDWFMNPYAFVLQNEHLYCDKSGKNISFVYIPSKKGCSDHAMLKNMVTDIAKKNRVTDVNLENKAVWAIQEFEPNSFLEMLKPYRAIAPQQAPPAPAQQPPMAPPPVQQAPPAPVRQAPPPVPVQQAPQQAPAPARPAAPAAPVAAPSPPVPSGGPDEIAIRFPAKGQAAEKPKGGLFSSKKEKEPKPEKAKGGKWGKKKNVEIIQGAAAMPAQPAHPVPPPNAYPAYTPSNEVADDATQIDMPGPRGVPQLRYTGTGAHPKLISVGIAAGEAFTIGRFDTNLGRRQSNFEFEPKTKAVSRRHAAIERRADGFYIVDLSSAAGTFINGQKIPPNAPFKLERGCRISLGNAGADYVWEE